MKEEKNLDRLFQEKFKDFEQRPSDAVWKRIAAAQQEEKEDRKMIPFWWRLGGAAAVIALLFTTGILLFTTPSDGTTENSIVSTDSNEEVSTTNSQEQNDLTNREDNDGIIVVQSNPANNQNINSISSLNSSKPLANKVPTNLSGVQIAQKGSGNTVVNPQQLNYVDKNKSKQEEASNAIAQNKVQEDTQNERFDKTSVDKSLENQRKPTTTIAQTTQENTSEDEVKNDTEKLSLVEEAQRIEDDKKESEAVALLDENPNSKRWGVGAIAAPVYYGDFGGSGLDPAFSDNTKSGDVNFSYGVQVSYAVSPKLKVRTGVSNVDLSYNTDGISFTPNTNARRLRGIDYSQNAQALNIIDESKAGALANPRDGVIENDLRVNVVGGSLSQRIGFVEIPVEAVYTISDKRLGVQVVGGMSTLLLNNNEVLLNSDDGLQSNLGTANGLNEVSFTTNIGLGLNYKMTDKLNLNVEPSLKYQLNAFNESVGDFKPYYVGIYTGVSYRF